MKRKAILVLLAGVVSLISFVCYLGVEQGKVQRKMQGLRVNMDLRQLSLAVSNYSNVFGNPPLGDNAAMFTKLAGQNPRHTVFISVYSDQTNSFGQFLDQWGTPYKIRITKDDLLSISSAGRNCLFGDDDDLSLEQGFGAPNSVSSNSATLK